MIVIGVKDAPGGERQILGIPQDQFVDAATYQQLIQENIEPDLAIEYKPHVHKDALLGLLVIRDRHNPPYLMRKDFRSLRRGDGYIRKGTHQMRLHARTTTGFGNELKRGPLTAHSQFPSPRRALTFGRS